MLFRSIRVPTVGFISSGKADETNYAMENQYKVEEMGEDVAIIGLGDFLHLAKEIAALVKEQTGKQITVINPKFITGIDEVLLDELKQNHKYVITLEDGILEGGFGEKIARYYGMDSMKVKNYGIKKSFIDRYNPDELLEENGITKEIISEQISGFIK